MDRLYELGTARGFAFADIQRAKRDLARADAEYADRDLAYRRYVEDMRPEADGWPHDGTPCQDCGATNRDRCCVNRT